MFVICACVDGFLYWLVLLTINKLLKDPFDHMKSPGNVIDQGDLGGGFSQKWMAISNILFWYRWNGKPITRFHISNRNFSVGAFMPQKEPRTLQDGSLLKLRLAPTLLPGDGLNWLASTLRGLADLPIHPIPLIDQYSYWSGSPPCRIKGEYLYWFD